MFFDIFQHGITNNSIKIGYNMNQFIQQKKSTCIQKKGGYHANRQPPCQNVSNMKKPGGMPVKEEDICAVSMPRSSCTGIPRPVRYLPYRPVRPRRLRKNRGFWNESSFSRFFKTHGHIPVAVSPSLHIHQSGPRLTCRSNAVAVFSVFFRPSMSPTPGRGRG